LPRVRFGPDDKVALLFGAEGDGLSLKALDASDIKVRIPMAAGVDSLNVARLRRLLAMRSRRRST